MAVEARAEAAGTIRLGAHEVNRLGFGGMRILGPGKFGEPPDKDVARSVLRRAVDLGVNLIDTADAYGPEVSENLIAEALFPYPDDLVIATKGGLLRPDPKHWPRDGRPEHLRRACEASLRRLRLEQIPVYYLHWPDDKVPFAESVGALVDLQQQGKIRHVAVSNVDAVQLKTAQSLTDIVCVQNRFNLGDRSAVGILKACQDSGIPFVPWAPIQSLDQNTAVAEIARRHEASSHQVVLAWLLALSPQMLPIPGTGSVAHVESNVAAASIRLDAAEVEAISAA